MRLKKLELQGFKSFVDRTEITFEDGITAVVGPNGSGKSNISDALRWVLGEQSARTLRGGKMGDVIFSGTQKRNAVGFCKVELVFDNEDKWLNVDFNEVSVSRKYYKSGESVYYINNNECRLKDVLELFRDTGVGKEGYSIIGQGQITNILSSNSGERRMAFEAATGILRYKSRKTEAQSRLVKTGENIDRLQDLLDEINLNLENLEVQSRDAKEYLKLKGQLREYELARFIHKTKTSMDRQKALKKELASIEQVVLTANETVDSLKDKRDILSKELKEASSSVEELKQKHIEMREQLLKSGSQTEVTFERIKGLRENTTRLSDQIGILKEEISLNTSLLKDEELRLKNTRFSLKEAGEIYHNTLRDHEGLKNELELQETNLEDIKQKRILFLNSVSEVKINASKYNTMLESIKGRMGDINKGILSIGEKIDQLEKEQSCLIQTRQSLNNKRQELDDNKKAFLAKKEDIINQKERAIKGIHEFDVNKGAILSRLNLLKNLQKEYDGYNYAVKNLMKIAKTDGKINKLVRGSVADIIDVDKKYVTAIETALGGALQNIVTSTEEDAKALIEVLKSGNMGRATFLPISSVKPMFLNNDEINTFSSVKGVIGCGVDLVHAGIEFDPIIQKLLGRTVVVEDLECAITLMRKNAFRFQTVTVDGDIIHAGGAMSGGSKSKKGVGLLSRNDEIVALEKQLTDLEKENDEHKKILSGLDSSISAVDDDFIANKRSLKEVYDKMDELQNEISILDAQIKGETDKLVAFNEEKEQLTDNQLDIEDKLKLVSGEQQKDTANIDENEINELSRAVYELREKNEAAHEQISSLFAAKGGLEKDETAILRDVDRIGREIAAKSVLLEKNMQTVKDINTEIEKLKSSVSQKAQSNKEDELLEIKLKKDIENGEKNLYILQAKLKDNELQIEQNREAIRENTDRKYKIDIETSKLSLETEMLSGDMFERYDLTFEDAEKLELSCELGVYKKEIDTIKDQIKDMGNVNLNSIEEYSYTHSRHSQITAQLIDLCDSKRDLEELIEMLQKDMTLQFQEQFALINNNFGRIFQSLFGGGKAELLLNKNESVLECDIEIIAQPPGKKLQTISLLSGGEKSLTAIAILFAMLELKPTPFCVLDEIESALDEANVHYFATYLKNYSKKTQFLVITHRRGVMDLSDAIYGVAMQEKGVSKVVSIKMPENIGGQEGEKSYGVI